MHSVLFNQELVRHTALSTVGLISCFYGVRTVVAYKFRKPTESENFLILTMINRFVFAIPVSLLC